MNALPLLVIKLSPRLMFFICRSNIKVRVIGSQVIVQNERSCHKECTSWHVRSPTNSGSEVRVKVKVFVHTDSDVGGLTITRRTLVPVIKNDFIDVTIFAVLSIIRREYQQNYLVPNAVDSNKTTRLLHYTLWNLNKRPHTIRRIMIIFGPSSLCTVKMCKMRKKKVRRDME